MTPIPPSEEAINDINEANEPVHGPAAVDTHQGVVNNYSQGPSPAGTLSQQEAVSSDPQGQSPAGSQPEAVSNNSMVEFKTPKKVQPPSPKKISPVKDDEAEVIVLMQSRPISVYYDRSLLRYQSDNKRSDT